MLGRSGHKRCARCHLLVCLGSPATKGVRAVVCWYAWAVRPQKVRAQHRAGIAERRSVCGVHCVGGAVLCVVPCFMRVMSWASSHLRGAVIHACHAGLGVQSWRAQLALVQTGAAVNGPASFVCVPLCLVHTAVLNMQWCSLSVGGSFPRAWRRAWCVRRTSEGNKFQDGCTSQSNKFQKGCTSEAMGLPAVRWALTLKHAARSPIPGGGVS